EGKALFDGATVPVFTRLAEVENTIYLDLANEAWEMVEITAGGWRVVDGRTVKFRRPKGMQALPIPERGGRLDGFRDYLNVDDDGWRLMVAWLIGTFRYDRPFPVLAVAGEYGTAKTTACKMLRRVVDPNVTDLCAFPRQED